jgi:peptidyl-prolyl cis-trans isomerase SDCCAG10
MEADIRKLSKRAGGGGGGGGDSDDDAPATKKPKTSALADELARYAGKRGHKAAGKRKGRDEDAVLAALSSFRSKLQGSSSAAAPDADEADMDIAPDAQSAAAVLPDAEDAGIEVDTDVGFLSHALSFPKGNEEEVEKAARDYEVIDPRARGAQAKEEERARKAKEPRARRRG